MSPVQHLQDVEKCHACAEVHHRISVVQTFPKSFLSFNMNCSNVVSLQFCIQYSRSIMMRVEQNTKVAVAEAHKPK